MTATERVYKGGKENEILSMDDPKDYGNTLSQMTYKEAIDAGVVSDYKIVSFNVTDAEYREIIQNNEYIRLNNNPKQNDDVTARELATALALRKTFKKLKISKALSFHSSIRRADKFEDLNKQISKDFKKYPSIETYHVSSKQKSSDRVQEMRSFEQSNKSLITNARCLTEGVDVPAIDCVAFIDSKRSKIDIVQASGRSMRVSKGKKYGYILVPIVTNLNDIKSASIDTEYEDLIAIITSLATQDERLIDEIKSIKNKRKTKGSKTKIIQITTTSLKKIATKRFDEKIHLKVWDKIKQFNYLPFEEAKKIIRKMKFKSQKEFYDYVYKNRNIFEIPGHPSVIYKKDWISWADFLGNENIANILKHEMFLSYEDAKKWVKKNKLNNTTEWKKATKRKDFPNFIPKNPENSYRRDKSWKNWHDFFGRKKPNFIKYDEAKKIVQKLNIKTETEYHRKHKEKLSKYNLPYKPERQYLNNGWEDWSKFLNNKLFRNRNIFSYDESKKYLKKFKIRSLKQFNDFLKKERDSLDPRLPRGIDVYKKNGTWKNLPDYLSYEGDLSRFLKRRNWKSFNQSKSLAKKYKIKTNKDWRNFLIKNSLYDYPKYPNEVYSDKEWKGWDDFLGK